MPKVTDNTWVVGENGAPVLLAEGDDVPAWATAQVGAHLLDGDAGAEDIGDGPVAYADRRVADLEAEIDRRNADRDPEGDSYIRPEGSGRNGAVVKDDLVAALEADDAAQADPGSGDGE